MQDNIFVRYFEANECFTRGVSSSFITLIPKSKDLLTLNDYQPISLIGSLYKIIAKALVNHIKRVIGMVINGIQTGFIDGCNILDGPFIIKDNYSSAKKEKQKVFLFKVDFDKVFDSVN